MIERGPCLALAILWVFLPASPAGTAMLQTESTPAMESAAPTQTQQVPAMRVVRRAVS